MTRQVDGARDEGIEKCEKCLRKAEEKGFSRRKGSSECLICLPASLFLLIPLLNGSSCYSSPSGRISKENSFLIAVYTSRRVDPKFRLLSRLMTPPFKIFAQHDGILLESWAFNPEKGIPRMHRMGLVGKNIFNYTECRCSGKLNCKLLLTTFVTAISSRLRLAFECSLAKSARHKRKQNAELFKRVWRALEPLKWGKSHKVEEKEAQKVSKQANTGTRLLSAQNQRKCCRGKTIFYSSRERVVRVHVTTLIQLVFMFLLEMHLKSQLILNLSQLNTFFWSLKSLLGLNAGLAMAVVFHLIFRFFFHLRSRQTNSESTKKHERNIFWGFSRKLLQPKKIQGWHWQYFIFYNIILKAAPKTNKIKMFSNICEKNKFVINFHSLPTLTSKKSDSCFKNHRQACLKPRESAEIKKQFGEHEVFWGKSRKAQKIRHELSDQSPHRVNLIRGEQIVLKSSQTRKNWFSSLSKIHCKGRPVFRISNCFLAFVQRSLSPLPPFRLITSEHTSLELDAIMLCWNYNKTCLARTLTSQQSLSIWDPGNFHLHLQSKSFNFFHKQRRPSFLIVHWKIVFM